MQMQTNLGLLHCISAAHNDSDKLIPHFVQYDIFGSNITAICDYIRLGDQDLVAIIQSKQIFHGLECHN